jgi:hypothetical protein
MNPRHIDEIISVLLARNSKIRVVQHRKIHPADDDNLWFFRIASLPGDVQIESADGNCPFLLEDSSMRSAAEAVKLQSVEQVVEAICKYFETNEALNGDGR